MLNGEGVAQDFLIITLQKPEHKIQRITVKPNEQWLKQNNNYCEPEEQLLWTKRTIIVNQTITVNQKNKHCVNQENLSNHCRNQSKNPDNYCNKPSSKITEQNKSNLSHTLLFLSWEYRSNESFFFLCCSKWNHTTHRNSENLARTSPVKNQTNENYP